MSRNVLYAVAASLLAIVAGAAHAQTWPTKPITLVVTYPAGGGADTMARLIAPKLGEALGQPVIIENKPGASGQIGASAVAKAAPDGYTLMLDASSFAVNPALFPRLPYDSDKAFRPVGVIALFPNVLLVNPSVPAASVKELVALAKAKKNGVSYASSGNGSAQHLAGAMFESAAGVDMLHVPYKGGAPALNDVIGGQVPVFFGNLASTLQHVQAGKLKPLAVTSARRSPILPAVPTMAEAGVAGYEVYEWNVLFAPAGTSEAIIGKLAAALQKTLDAADVKARIAQLGGEIQTARPDAAQQFVRQQTTLWARLVRERGISVD
ncbi:MAG TPA: tripartite tricarboxylate transporter substrate binding protein [Casimicrobium huifangae]|jgi:tripartite-type tricarboxylate transporter receptor subunit TctC|uniref:tripartite tricarboxylate transporter substrate binding protein n=1 Tax=Casimicrobium huifangae TaxID=2591109 RepID=UPI0012EBEA09|nr:tripartite tricarboxylate transporter substrate binding protein [Casimicrobium huifangae]HOB02867.1 tripartite tricarboxylate transporter substrate binding protein [Casimicrobium huifangae]HQA35143.1 tripartite tricarboxylate transporter substrate binding protein [Casimicrobium huifangae]HQD64866.1 tripartite tricarboxylate transporter substrate binding protein [Casimicrobium huifangae]